MLKTGQIAPDFELPDQDGNTTRLSDLLETGALVLYFYPKDDTPGCTKEACAFRDNIFAFEEKVAISTTGHSLKKITVFEVRPRFGRNSSFFEQKLIY